MISERCSSVSYDLSVSSNPKPNPEFDAITTQNGTRYDRGPGIEVWWARPPEDPVCGYFLIRLFGKIDLRAMVLPKSMPPAP